MKSFLVSVAALSLVLAPQLTWAQTDEFSFENMPEDLKNQTAYRKINPLPLAYVSDIKAAVSASGLVSGSFVASSGETGGLGDLQYEILLLQPLPKTAPNELVVDSGAVYDRLVVQEPFSLLGNEKKTVSFTYQPPHVPTGEYRLRIQLMTSNDRKLGWGDTSLALTGQGSFAVLDTQSVVVQSVDPITKQAQDVWEPLEGPNVAPEDKISLKLFATNVGTTNLQGTIAIETERILMSENYLNQQTGEVLTLTPKESREVTIPIVAASVPGSYRVLVSLRDTAGQRVSGMAEFRYVVQGISASIVSQTVASLPNHKGETAQIHFTVAGAADRATPVQGVLEISLKDGRGELGKVENTISIPSAAPVQGVAAIALLQQRCGIPTVTLTLRTKDGQLLDAYTASYPSLEVKSCGLATLLGNTTLLIALGIRARHQSTPTLGSGSGTIVGALLLLAILASGAWFTRGVEANGIQYVYHHDDPNNPNEQVRPELYVAYPNHNSEISSLQVPYAARFSWISCDNAIAAGWLRVYMKATPGKVDWFQGQNWIQAPFAKYIEIPRTCKCDSRPRRVVDLSGTLQLPDMPAGSATTIWTSGDSQGSWRGGALIHDFTWLTFKPSVDLKVEKQGPVVAAAGELIKYTVTVTNTSSLAAQDVKAVDQLVAGFTFDATQSSSECTLNGSVVTCSVAQLSAGASKVFTIAARPSAAHQCGDPLANRVSVSSSAADTNTSNSNAETVAKFDCGLCRDGADNDNDGKVDAQDSDCDGGTSSTSPGTTTPTGPTTSTVNGVDAAITIAAPSSVEQGSLLNYSVGARNNGSQEAKDVAVSVAIPNDFSFNTSNSSGACSKQGNNVQCSLGTLAPGQSSPLAVVFTVGSTAACNSKVSAKATVTTTSEDKDSSNNSATSNETTITCGACRDKVDNDNDGRIDDADPACHLENNIDKAYDPTRTTENDTQCTDQKDNDNDNFIDQADAGCHQDDDLNKQYIPADNNEGVNTQFDPGGFRVVE
jgi:uncharacterized repeat protein (TIGR01451 family)